MNFVAISVLAILAISSKLCYANTGSKTQNCVQVVEGLPDNLMGGWREHDMSEEEDVFKQTVAELADKALEEHNKMSNDMCQYAVSEGGRLKVFTQVVSGTNYCIQFIGKAEGTKTRNSNDICATKAVKCTSKIYEPFSGPQEINELECH